MFQITLTALVWLCIFNVSSNCLPLRMRGHIGCIYSTFPMFESPTGCTFSLLCVFKLPAGNQSIWEACPSDNLVAFIQFFPMFEITQVALDFDFFDSAFSNVSSNWLPLRMQSHIGCICLTFLPTCFLMCPQTVSLRRGKITLVAFIWIFSTMYFRMYPPISCIWGCII